MNHSFDVDIAKEYGIKEAILLNYFEFWIAKNKANKSNFHEGRYWTYNSIPAFTELFPYMSVQNIKTALNSLKEKELILTGNYNELSYDRTMWYALSDKGLSIFRNQPIHKLELTDGLVQTNRPIPVTNHLQTICIAPEPSHCDTPVTNSYTEKIVPEAKPRKQTKFIVPSVEEIRSYCNERKNNIDAEYFLDYQETRGWILSNGRKAVDWKACIRTWEHNEKNNGRSAPSRYEAKLDCSGGGMQM